MIVMHVRRGNTCYGVNGYDPQSQSYQKAVLVLVVAVAAAIVMRVLDGE
jgi:hypothetical protein